MFLAVNEIRVGYGSLIVIKSLSIDLKEGEIVAILGPNGAGKTTLLKAISGLIQSTKGNIVFKDKKIDDLSTEEIVKMGIAHVPEGRRLFGQLTVLENLLMGAYLRVDKKEINGDLNRIFALFERLYERRKLNASSLSGGEQQMLAIGRALMAKPKLILMDEPTLGLSLLMRKRVMDVIDEINKSGISIILVEQNATMSLRVASRAYILELGQIVATGYSAELLESDEVRKAYLW
jgi:branched-chain amino acid transport system ATP-binding protein